MHRLVVTAWADWRDQARQALGLGLTPEQLIWHDAHAAAQETLFTHQPDPWPAPVLPPQPGSTFSVPKAFLGFAEKVAHHRDPERWQLIYRCLWRLTHGERHLLEDQADPLVRRLQLMLQAVGRDIHKMHAFVRFRKIELDGQETYLAFHQPDHYIVRPASPFFQKRFRNMRWGILTPDESVSWDTNTLFFGAGMPASAAPQHDDIEDLWRTYYRHIFNPARIKTKAMRREMPVRHWATLPEADIIQDMLNEAPRRVADMMKYMHTPSEGARKRQQRHARLRVT